MYCPSSKISKPPKDRQNLLLISCIFVPVETSIKLFCSCSQTYNLIASLLIFRSSAMMDIMEMADAFAEILSCWKVKEGVKGCEGCLLRKIRMKRG